MSQANCPDCGDGFTNLAMHWYHTPEHRPNISEHHHEILTGLLMGDGHVNRGHDVPYIDINTISKNYLEYLDHKFGWLSTGVRLYRTAEENVANGRKTGFIEGAKAEDHSDIYVLKTRSHPDLQQYADWYDTGKKTWPDNIHLTPTVLKHWFCGDGSRDTYDTVDTIRISTANEAESDEKLKSLFERAGLPVPNLVKTESDGYVTCSCRFTAEESKALWEYMGDPLPDFGYKWPDEY